VKKEKEIGMEELTLLKFKFNSFWESVVREKDTKLKEEDKKIKYEFITMLNNFFDGV
jgi:hypothetical protein